MEAIELFQLYWVKKEEEDIFPNYIASSQEREEKYIRNKIFCFINNL